MGTKWSEIKPALMHLAINRNTWYSNEYPTNCLYVHDDNSVSCDCIGLIKNVINTPNQAYSTVPGSMGNPGGPVIADLDEWGLINLCPDKSRNFSTLEEGEILMTVFDGQGEEYGHGGWFVGDFVDERYGNCVVNTIQCSSFYEYTGIQTTWTDKATGCHYTSRGGRYIGQWDYHGHLEGYVDMDTPVTPKDDGTAAISEWITSLGGSFADFSAITLVYDTDYYYNGQPDLANLYGRNHVELLNHFCRSGMAEGRRASEQFDVAFYKKNNADLQKIYGDCLPKYYIHYMTAGWKEGRKGTK